ncbi:MAG: class I SAM-dependent RNA methyltransferase [Clostridia bacterium]|nr:class I SAM-dependent RNA methyltransferase [Clostridia bacterium]
MSNYNFAAPCLMGVEKLLSNELKFMGASNVKADNGRVFFEGDESILARANICSRFAERILIIAGRFTAQSFEELFQGVKNIEWERFIGKKDKFPVKGSCLSSVLRSVPDCQAIIKKAVVERLGNVYNVDWFEESGSLFQIRFLILKNDVCIMIDTGGSPLHKRGYRANSNDAPIKETLAAALVELSRVRSNHTVIDPCCGSGTILIEAAQKALKIPPNSKRSFVCESWNIASKDCWEKERVRADNETNRAVDFHGYGYDIDERALEIARDNARKAGVDDFITFQKRDIKDFSESFERATVICNPPYGERLLDIGSAEELYRIMGQKFISKPGWSYTIISPDDDFEKCFGRSADKRRKLYNGMILCQAYQYFK